MMLTVVVVIWTSAACVFAESLLQMPAVAALSNPASQGNQPSPGSPAAPQSQVVPAPQTAPTNSDWLRTFLTGTAVVVSLASLVCSVLVARWSWLRTNRPVVAAMVKTHDSGRDLITYKLVVMNTGTRPATNVQLHADPELVRNCLVENAPKEFVDKVLACFDPIGLIPLLVNGGKTSNSFGVTAADKSPYGTWKVGSRLPITISYRDLDNRKYLSNLDLVVKDTKGFAGGAWEPVRRR